MDGAQVLRRLAATPPRFFDSDREDSSAMPDRSSVGWGAEAQQLDGQALDALLAVVPPPASLQEVAELCAARAADGTAVVGARPCAFHLASTSASV